METDPVVIPEYRHRFLILHHSGSDPHFPLSWDFPGGELGLGEDHATGALHELTGESASEPSKEELEKIGTFERNGVILHLYRLKKSPLTFKNEIVGVQSCMEHQSIHIAQKRKGNRPT